MNCAPNDGMKLSNDVKESYQWFFIVNTCDSLSKYTMKTDCYSEQSSMDILSDFLISTKISNEFFSTKTFIENGSLMNSVFRQETFQLSKTLSARYAYTV